MAKKNTTHVPNQLPDCFLIKELINKAAERTDTTFDFIGQLIRFKERITGEIQYINQLFPEYLPHDEQYHIKNLFHVADKLLGDSLIRNLNSSELFVLACSLYGHDWGMAVNEKEHKCIVSGTKPDDLNELIGFDVAEHKQFILFAKSKILDLNQIKLEGNLEIWRDYVRATHHIRSGKRIRKYFEEIGLGVQEAIARVCESHGLDCSLLADPDAYPLDFSVISENVNLRALAVYLRLVDLFDLGDDRAPYVIWKFVWPQDPLSKMEWEKHRALQPVTFPEYYPGRIVQVDGSTDDIEVFAALEDLKRYCQNQLELCCDLMTRMNDIRHKLDLTSNIRWRVVPRKFKRVSIRFEFDRERMFEILGSEIYHGDHHVFLRELLQNSIDAIRLRRAAFQGQGMTAPNNLGCINVNVKNGENNDCVISWKDDGAGMDEYIIQNYLAMAGKSYYHSQEFKKLGLDIDPISRFGIGILSCFVVAERIEITTFKERYLPSPSKPLHVVIPSVNRQFRIEELNEESAKTGTTIEVFVQGIKLLNHDTNKIENLKVTEYLLNTAGFVEFPIAINENGKKTIIANPYQNPEHVKQSLGKDYEDYEIKQLSLDYPWKESAWPVDLTTIMENFKVEKFDLKNDLNLVDYEGELIYPVPIDYGQHFSIHGRGLCLLNSIYAENKGKSVRWAGEPHGAITSENLLFYFDYFQSQDTYKCDGIYRDGISVPKAFIPKKTLSYNRANCPPQLLLCNLPKSRTKVLDISRTEILGKSEEWTKPIFDNWITKLAALYQDSFKQMEPLERLIKMISFAIFNHVPLEKLSEIIPIDFWPLLFVNKGGNICIKLFPEIKENNILELPQPLHTISAYNIRSFFKENKIEKPWENWQGETALVSYDTWSGENESIVYSGINGYLRFIQNNYYEVKNIRFLKPPWHGDPPLLQNVWEPNNKKNQEPLTKTDMEKLILEPKLALTDNYWERCIQTAWGVVMLPVTLIVFPKKFKQYFAYGNECINIDHPSVQIIIKLLLKYLVARFEGKLDKNQSTNMGSVIYSIIFSRPGVIGSQTYNQWANNFNELKYLLPEGLLLNKEEWKSLPPPESDFVPGSMDSFLGTKVKRNWAEPFGKIL